MSSKSIRDFLTPRKARWMPECTVSLNSTAVMAEPMERMASWREGRGGRGREERGWEGGRERERERERV